MNVSEYRVPRDLLESADKLLNTIDPAQFDEIEKILSITGRYLPDMQSVLSHPHLLEIKTLIIQHTDLQNKFASHKVRLQQRREQLQNGQLWIRLNSGRIQKNS